MKHLMNEAFDDSYFKEFECLGSNQLHIAQHKKGLGKAIDRLEVCMKDVDRLGFRVWGLGFSLHM
jgi:hypothetical protein